VYPLLIREVFFFFLFSVCWCGTEETYKMVRRNARLGIFVQLEVPLDSKRCRLDADLCLSLKFSGEEAGTLSGFTAPSVVNLVLLKCRKLRREDQETSDWIVSRIILLRTQAVGICSHRNLNLK